MFVCKSNVRATLKCVMFAGPENRSIFARLSSVCALPGEFEIGVARNASTESTSYCGVWTATRYCTPRLSIQKLGDTVPDDDSETSRSLATSLSDSPACWAIVRSIETLSCGTRWTCER